MTVLDFSYVDAETKEPMTVMSGDYGNSMIEIRVNGELLTYLAVEYEFVADELMLMLMLKFDDLKFAFSFEHRVMDMREGVRRGYDETYYSIPHRLMFVDGDFLTAVEGHMWLFVELLDVLKRPYMFTSMTYMR